MRPASYIPLYGNYFSGGRGLFASYFQATLSSGYLCNNDTFSNAATCGGGPYTFTVNTDGSGQPAWQGQQTRAGRRA